MAPRFTVLVELFLGGAWVDITSDVRTAGGGIEITRGRRDEGSQTDPARCTLTLNNRLGVYSPRNPTSPYYGLFARNTPLRVSVNGFGRFVGEVVSLPVRWDVSGADVWVPLEAAGILRRLGQGTKPLRSALHRAVSVDPGVIAYWPLEDAEGATTAASGIPGRPPMRVAGTPSFEAFDGVPGSAALPTVGKASFSGPVIPHTNTGAYVLRFLLSVPSAGTSTQRLISMHGTGSVARWDLRYVSGGGGSAVLRAYDDEENLLNESGAQLLLDGVPSLIKVSIEQNGSDVDWQFEQLHVSTGDFFTALAGTFTSRTIGEITAVTVNGFHNLGDVAFGHVNLLNTSEPFPPSEQLINPMLGWVGELAGRRMARLCAETGTPFQAAGDLSSTPAMGVQGTDTLLTLLTECAEVDGGVLHEARDEVALVYRPASSMYNQGAA